MPLPCNGVGDVLALIQLAITIATFVADYRVAPNECRALLQDLRSMERLLRLSLPTILAIQDPIHKEAVMEQLQIVSRHVQEALDLVAKFRSAGDRAPIEPHSQWHETVFKWVSNKSDRVAWALKRSGDARACRLAIAQSFEPLSLALLLAWNGEQSRVLSLLQQCQGDLLCDIQRVAAGQVGLHREASLLADSHNRLHASLTSMNEQGQRMLSMISDEARASHANTNQILRDLSQLGSFAASSRHELHITIEDSFRQVRGELSDLKRGLREQAEVLAQFMADSRDRSPARRHLLPSRMTVTTKSIIEGSGAFIARFSLDATSTGPVIVATLLLASRATSPAERMTWTGLAFALFIAHHITRLYKSPMIIHIIFVKGFCDEEFEVSVAEASSAVRLRRALSRRLVGKIGDNLLKQRMYEVHKSAGSTAPTRLPASWTVQLLRPGDKIELAALVERFTDNNTTSQTVTCLSCSEVIPTGASVEHVERPDVPRWVTCTRCSARVQVSSGGEGSTHAIDSADDKDADDDDYDEDGDQHAVSKSDGRTGSAEVEVSNTTSAISLQDTLRLCRRIHFIYVPPSHSHSDHAMNMFPVSHSPPAASSNTDMEHYALGPAHLSAPSPGHFSFIKPTEAGHDLNAMPMGIQPAEPPAPHQQLQQPQRKEGLMSSLGFKKPLARWFGSRDDRDKARDVERPQSSTNGVDYAQSGLQQTSSLRCDDVEDPVAQKRMLKERKREEEKAARAEEKARRAMAEAWHREQARQVMVKREKMIRQNVQGTDFDWYSSSYLDTTSGNKRVGLGRQQQTPTQESSKVSGQHARLEVGIGAYHSRISIISSATANSDPGPMPSRRHTQWSASAASLRTVVSDSHSLYYPPSQTRSTRQPLSSPLTHVV